jgi:hypothetical protein
MALFKNRRSRTMLYTVIGMLICMALFYKYYNIFEETQVNRFFTKIVAGDYEAAYKLWQPTARYQYSDFLEDWGDAGFYAGTKIKTFRITSSHSQKGNFVEIKILLNGVKEIALVVNKEDKHFSFAP